MRHRHSHRQLNRATDQRIALLRGLVRNLLRNNRIKTTAPKAKEASRMAERMISLAKRGDLASRRMVLRITEQGEELVRQLAYSSEAIEGTAVQSSDVAALFDCRPRCAGRR